LSVFSSNGLIYSQHSDEVIKIYQIEISNLQMNQKRLETEIEKYVRDQEESQKKNMQLMDDLAQSKSSVKDTAINKDVLEREVQRLTSEVAVLKETVVKKDDDLRYQMQNMYEIQRNGLEEKTTIRQEIRCVSYCTFPANIVSNM
jgi:seryl-tRNA synthetase